MFFIVEDMPVFNGKDNEFRIFIHENLRYPEAAANNNIQGRIFVQFSVSSTGQVVDTKIVRGVHKLLDDEALRVVNLSPRWRPGIQGGIPVKVQFVIPIVFRTQ